MSLALSSKKAPECGTERNAAGCKVQKPIGSDTQMEILDARQATSSALWWSGRIYRALDCHEGVLLLRLPFPGWFKGKPRGHPQFLGSPLLVANVTASFGDVSRQGAGILVLPLQLVAISRRAEKRTCPSCSTARTWVGALEGFWNEPAGGTSKGIRLPSFPLDHKAQRV